MTNAIELTHVNKRYPRFALKDISLALPAGQIMGFLGENGAGKTTTIKTMLGLVRRDGGKVKLLGMDLDKEAVRIKEDVGIVFDDCAFPSLLTAAEVGRMMKGIYQNWDGGRFETLCRDFTLDPKKPVKDYSRGMRMKLSLAAAMSHHSRLLILDEPTSGLDPVVREEILDIFQAFIQDETHSILFSSHITTDLDKIADSVAFMHEGKLLFCRGKDEMLDNMGILRASQRELAALPKDQVARVRKNAFGCEALIQNKRDFIRQHPSRPIDPAHLEDIMLFYIKGEIL